MDRILGTSAIDLGGGKLGFRSENLGTGIEGTILTAEWLNALQEEVMAMIEAHGQVPSNGDLKQLARAIQGGKLNYVVATGTANAWLVDPSLALTAYAAGRVLWVIAPATNTSATVNVNMSGLGNRRIKKASGYDPVAGDLVAGQVYPTIDDGTSIRVIVPLPSDRLSTAYLGFHGDGTSISYANNVGTLINAYGASPVNNLPGASYAAGIITIGTTGFYFLSANMLSLMPGGTNYGYGLSVSKVDAGGTALVSLAAQQTTVSTASVASSLAGSVGAIAKMTAGDRIAGFFRHNQGAAQNATISIDIEFRGA